MGSFRGAGTGNQQKVRFGCNTVTNRSVIGFPAFVLGCNRVQQGVTRNKVQPSETDMRTEVLEY